LESRYRHSRCIAIAARTNSAKVLGKTHITQNHTLSGLRGRTVKPLTMRGADNAALTGIFASSGDDDSINVIQPIYHGHFYWKLTTS
jgi:hypothetical protein